MGAIGFLCLILFLIGLCLAVYYAYICYDVPSSRTHTILQSEDGPWLKYPSDFNDNKSVVIPLENRLDEPDVPPAETLMDVGRTTNATAPAAAVESVDNRMVEVEHVQLERSRADDETKALLLEMDQEVVGYGSSGPLPNGDAEDGLVLTLPTSASAIMASGRSDRHVHFPYIDTAEDDDVAEGTSCDQPPRVIRNITFVPRSRADPMTHGAARDSASKEGHHNPIDDIKVHVVMPSSNRSSCEELHPSPSEDSSDTSEPDVTEYSFGHGPNNMESVSDILADEIGMCLEPKVTKIAALTNCVGSSLQESKRRDSTSSDSCTSDSTTRLPSSKDHFPTNTPPSTPPETDSRCVINNPAVAAKIYSTQTKAESFVVLKTHRSSSVSSGSSSLSAEECDVTSAKVTAKLLQQK